MKKDNCRLPEIIETEQFYPTPPALIDRMLDKIDMTQRETFLEPEAGKGDIAEQILRRLNRERHRCGMKGVSIDCVEIDPYLRQILQYNFSADRMQEQSKRLKELNDMLYSDRTPALNTEMEQIKAELNALDNMEIIHIVYDDFLTFRTAYDDMQPEEQAVVDSFQGREAYEEVRRNAEYYLADVSGIALLEGA